MNAGADPLGDLPGGPQPAGGAPEAGIEPGLMLIVTQGEPAGACVEVVVAPSLVGRARDCTLPLQDLTASRHHCKVWRDGTCYFVQDLGAKNQTRINGAAVAFSRMREGDALTVGITTIRLVSLETAVRIAVLFARASAMRRTAPADPQ